MNGKLALVKPSEVPQKVSQAKACLGLVNIKNMNTLFSLVSPYLSPYYSTQTALLRFTEDIIWNIDKGKMTILLLFDFSKAFDTISPSRLLRIMRDMGILRAVLCWISSYIKRVRSRSFPKCDINLIG